MTISRRLWLMSFGFLVALLVIGGMSLYNNRVLIGNLTGLTRVNMPAVSNAHLMDMMHDAIRGNAYQAIIVALMKDEAARNENRTDLEEYVKSIHEHIENLEALPLDGEIKERIQAAKTKVETYITAARAVAEPALGGDLHAALRKVPELQERFSELETDLEKLGKEIIQLSEESEKTAKRDAEVVQAVTLALIFLAVAAVLIFATLMIRALNKRMEGLSGELRLGSDGALAVADHLRSASTVLSSSSARQAAALQETAASIDEINSMAKATTDGTQRLEEAARASLAAAERGNQAVGKMLAAMQSIGEGNERIAGQIEDGNREITRIVTVISEIEAKTKVINDIVFQTKLLSFNASVEAARAGEHGKGFAIVAGEVGNLARISGAAAQEISTLLTQSVEQVQTIVDQNKKKVESLVADGKDRLENGRAAVAECGVSLDQIVTETTGVTEMISEIARAVGEQGQGVSEIGKAVRLLDQSTQENSSGAKQTEESAAKMFEQSVTMNELIDSLETLTRGKTSA